MDSQESRTTADNSPAQADFTAIRISGADRIEFLQGQLTQDLAELAPDRPLPAGWSNPKGRLLTIVWLVDWQDSVWLLLPAELLPGVLRRLSMFVLRADVTLEETPLPVSLRRSISSDKDPTNHCFDESFYCLDTADGASLLVGEAAADAPAELAGEAWRLAHIRSGRAWIWRATAEEFVPQMVNLDLIGGISFSKGCYVGQEIVARTHNLGRIKRRMYRFSSPANTSSSAGATVYAEGKPAGMVVDAVGTELLAVVRIESLQKSLALDEAGKQLLKMEPLPYVVPESI